jgi:Flp pilus assembly protein CpaB
MSMNHPSSGDQFGMPGGFGPGGYNTPPGASDYPLPQRPGASRPEPSGKKRGQKDKKEKAPKTSTKRLMSRQRLFALVFALVAVLLGWQLTAAPVESTYVIRTTSSIPALARIEDSQYEIISLPPIAVEEGAISAATEEDVRTLVSSMLEQGRTRMALPKGHQLHKDDFSLDASLATPLAADERILAIEANVVAAIGGQLKSGDRVDVIAVIDSQSRTISNLVAANIEIISILPGAQQFDTAAQEQSSGNRDKSGNELLPENPVPGIYNVRVNLNQAVLLAAAQSKGELVLVFRGSDATDPATTSPVYLEDVITGTPNTQTPTVGG